MLIDTANATGANQRTGRGIGIDDAIARSEGEVRGLQRGAGRDDVVDKPDRQPQQWPATATEIVLYHRKAEQAATAAGT